MEVSQPLHMRTETDAAVATKCFSLKRRWKKCRHHLAVSVMFLKTFVNWFICPFCLKKRHNWTCSWLDFVLSGTNYFSVGPSRLLRIGGERAEGDGGSKVILYYPSVFNGRCTKWGLCTTYVYTVYICKLVEISDSVLCACNCSFVQFGGGYWD